MTDAIVNGSEAPPGSVDRARWRVFKQPHAELSCFVHYLIDYPKRDRRARGVVAFYATVRITLADGKYRGPWPEDTAKQGASESRSGARGELLNSRWRAKVVRY